MAIRSDPFCSVFVHKEKTNVLERYLAVVDLLRHQAIWLRRADRHDEVDDLFALRGLGKLLHHLFREIVINFVERRKQHKLSLRAPHEFVCVQCKYLAHFLFAFLMCHGFFSFIV